MRKCRILWAILLALFLVSAACSNQDAQSEKKEDKQEEKEDEEQEQETVEIAEIEMLDYGKEVGLSLNPLNKDVKTVLHLQGSIEKADALNEPYIWVIVVKDEHIEEIDTRKFEYYIPIENGSFSKQLNLHHGADEYKVTVRIPSNDSSEELTYYDSAKFRVNNQADTIERDIEYSKYGVAKSMNISEPVTGWNDAEGAFEVNGTVADEYGGDKLIAEVKKDDEEERIMIPIRNGSFSGEIPLYFGEGHHKVQLQLQSDDVDEEDLFYTSATFYVNNQSSKEFSTIDQYAVYLESGLNLESPGWTVDMNRDKQEYPIKGTIDPDAPLADQVTHIIVVVEHLEEGEESTYIIPVEDYKFDGLAYFRFGPGEYQVSIHIPAEEQSDNHAAFHFTTALALNHQVSNVEDERDLLPSRGIQSDHPDIIKKAKEITSGEESDRDKAKAIFEFVTEHVAYDVEKEENDEFTLDDSALMTLELGTGICQDYAFLTTALLRSIEIESHYIEGLVGSSRHAWVEAKLDGEWIEMDPTWGAGYVDRDGFHFKYNEDYFDPNPNFLDETHTRQGIMY